MDARLFDAGILKSILLPNLAFSSSLVLPTYLLQRLQLPISTTSFWTAATLGNVFWLAISPRLKTGSLGQALKAIPRSQWLLLGALAGSATCLILDDLSKDVGKNDQASSRDALYTNKHDGTSSWRPYLSDWVGKILTHTLISLPLMAPFRNSYPVLRCPEEWLVGAKTCAVAMWTMTQAIYVLAASASEDSDFGLRDSIRHPTSLGLIFESLAYPLYLYSQNLFHPLFLLSPVTTYFTLKFGDSQNEHNLEDRLATRDPAQCVRLHERWERTNSLWPGLESLSRKWSWIVLAVGASTVVALRSRRI